MQAAFRSHDVTIYGDEKTREILGDAVQPVTEELYDMEFNDYKITVKVADSLEDAMAHIAKYSTKHSECIITRDLDVAQKFQRTVDAAVVYVNASTRSPTAANSATAQRSAFPPRNSTQEVLWVCTS